MSDMLKRNAQTQIITGLDIGSTGIRIAIGQSTPDERLGADIQIIGTTEVASAGIQKGAITSIEEAVSSVAHVLEEVERLVGLPIEHAWVGISGTQIISQESRGVVAVAKIDGEISSEDVDRVIVAAQTVASPLNHEVLHILPKTYTVDGQTGIKDPIGMTGVRLEVDAQIIYSATPHIKNISKAIYRTGIDIDELALTAVATADAVLSERQKQLGVALVDLGGSTTTIAVYEEGNLIHLATIPLGSNHITNDLALGLQTSIEVAERIKIAFGGCSVQGVQKTDKIQLRDVGAEPQEVSKRFIIEIISARVLEILEKINEELRKVQRQSLLPAGLVFVGGGAKLKDITTLTKEALHMNAMYGFPTGMRSATDKINDLSFTASIALVRWGAMAGGGSVSRSLPFKLPGGKQAVDQVRKLFRFLVP